MSNEVFVEMGDSEIEELQEVGDTVEVKVKLYQKDGLTRETDPETGALRNGKFTLHYPTPADAKAFAEFQRGVQKKKKIIAPSQQEVAVRALRYTLPKCRDASEAAILAMLRRTGGYLGDNAELANAALGILGQNFGDTEEQAEPVEKWADEEQTPG